jgi:hypothetical protein
MAVTTRTEQKEMHVTELRNMFECKPQGMFTSLRKLLYWRQDSRVVAYLNRIRSLRWKLFGIAKRTPLRVNFLYWVLIPSLGFATDEPSTTLDDHPEWFTCASTSECTSIKRGCYYWQPVNKKYRMRLPSSSCLKSYSAGPQPTASCVHHQCENAPFTVRDWSRLESYQKYQLVSSRVEVCRGAAGLSITSGSIETWTTRYEAELDKSIRERRFPENEVLTAAAMKVVPCDELIAWEREQEQWKIDQSRIGSARRVIIEQVQPLHSLNNFYPKLIEYAKVFEQCGQTSSRTGVTFWGDMRVTFSVKSDGTIDPGSVEATYPAVAYMHPFLDCASTAFKTLTFPKSLEDQPIRVTALIQVQSN